MKTNIDVVDFHTHILHGVDHGSKSLDVSLKQLKIASSHGVSRIVATSHFYPHKHTLDAFLQSRNNAACELLENYKDNKIQVKLGAEVLLCPGLENFASLEKLCFSGTKYLLLELPFLDFKNEYCDTVEALLDDGFDVILAHADRYPKENINTLISLGVNKLQLNAESLAKFIKVKHIYSWIESGYVVALGSDIHGIDDSAYKRFSKAKAKLSDKISVIKRHSDKIWADVEEFSTKI